MNDDQIERVARTSAKIAVQETFLVLGMDLSTPDGVRDTQETFAHLRRSHAATVAIRTYGIKAVVTALVGAIIALLWSGFLSKIKL